jgi:hypothetical protein
LKESGSRFDLPPPINNIELAAAKIVIQGLAEEGKKIENSGYESKKWEK